MSKGECVFRTVLGQLRHIVNRYEELGLVQPQAAQAARYQLAVEANELNGDDCRFPSCDCARADCSRRPSALPVAIWGGTAGEDSTRAS